MEIKVTKGWRKAIVQKTMDWKMSTRKISGCSRNEIFCCYKKNAVSSIFKTKWFVYLDLFACVCVCVCVCVYTCMRVRIIVCACRGQKRAPNVSLLGFVHFFEAGSFPEPGALVFTAKMKKSQQAQPPFSFCFISVQVKATWLEWEEARWVWEKSWKEIFQGTHLC